VSYTVTVKSAQVVIDYYFTKNNK